MQSAIVIENGTGSEVLKQLNNAFQTLASNNNGSSEPSTTFASMFWIDTSGTNAILKQRNADNTAWVILGTIIDGKFKVADETTIINKTITVSTTWSNTAAPFTQEIAVTDILESDCPVVDLIRSADITTAKSQIKEFSKIYKGVTEAGKITLYAKEKTATELNLIIKIVR